MVKLDYVIGFRVRVPNLTGEQFDEIKQELFDAFPTIFVESLMLPNHFVVIIPGARINEMEEFLESKDFSWKPATVHIRTSANQPRQ